MSNKVNEHPANERTFFAGIRTGIAVMAFGFVIARYGLASNSPMLEPKWLGIVFTMLGLIMLVVALFDFVHVRRTIDEERYTPGLFFPIVLTRIASLIGLLLAIYLASTM